MSESGYVTMKTAARLCGVTPRTVARWVDSGQLPAVFTTGGHRRIRRDDVYALLKSRRSLRARSSRGVIRVVVVGVREEMIRRLRRAVTDMGATLRLEHAWSTLEVGLWVGDLRPHLVLIDGEQLSDAHALAGALRSSPQASEARVIVTDSQMRRDPLAFRDLVAEIPLDSE